VSLPEVVEDFPSLAIPPPKEAREVELHPTMSVTDHIDIQAQHLDGSPPRDLDTDYVFPKDFEVVCQTFDIQDGSFPKISIPYYVGTEAVKLDVLTTRYSDLMSIAQKRAKDESDLLFSQRHDFRSHLPIRFEDSHVYYPTLKNSACSYKREGWSPTKAHLYTVLPDRCGDGIHCDAKPLIYWDYSYITSMIPANEKFFSKYPFARSYSLEYLDFYEKEGAWFAHHRAIPQYDACFPDKLSKVHKYFDFCNRLSARFDTYCGVAMQPLLITPGCVNSIRQFTLFKLLQSTDDFYFLDVEGSKSRNSYGVLRMSTNHRSRVCKVYFQENSPLSSNCTYYVKGGAVERKFLMDKGISSPVIDVDTLIPWTPEPAKLHSPLGGVLQMAYQVFAIKWGFAGSPFDYTPIKALLEQSQKGEFDVCSLTFSVIDICNVVISGVFKGRDDNPKVWCRPPSPPCSCSDTGDFGYEVRYTREDNDCSFLGAVGEKLDFLRQGLDH